MARFICLALLAASAALRAEPATERYAPAQLGAGYALLERARGAAALGDAGLAGKLAWQASLDARLAWKMTESPVLRADAAALGGAAASLVRRMALKGVP
ncbi:MAG TPA: hypothetical protein VFZ54_17645 [Burkholderiales bacterium]